MTSNQPMICDHSTPIIISVNIHPTIKFSTLRVSNSLLRGLLMYIDHPQGLNSSHTLLGVIKYTFKPTRPRPKVQCMYMLSIRGNNTGPPPQISFVKQQFACHNFQSKITLKHPFKLWLVGYCVTAPVLESTSSGFDSTRFSCQ